MHLLYLYSLSFALSWSLLSLLHTYTYCCLHFWLINVCVNTLVHICLLSLFLLKCLSLFFCSGYVSGGKRSMCGDPSQHSGSVSVCDEHLQDVPKSGIKETQSSNTPNSSHTDFTTDITGLSNHTHIPLWSLANIHTLWLIFHWNNSFQATDCKKALVHCTNIWMYSLICCSLKGSRTWHTETNTHFNWLLWMQNHIEIEPH